MLVIFKIFTTFQKISRLSKSWLEKDEVEKLIDRNKWPRTDRATPGQN